MVLVLIVTAWALLVSSVGDTLMKREGLRKYDCELGNFLYAGLSQGPELDNKGLIEIRDLKERQMRILRPTAGVGGCALGDDYAFLVRRGNTLDKVVVEFQGGGACWSEETCSRGDNEDFTDTSLLDTTIPIFGFSLLDCSTWDSWGLKTHSNLFGGLIDREEKDNPVSGWSYIFVSYCTKDVHIGNKKTIYGDNSTNTSMTINHRGQANVDIVMDYVKSQFPNPEKILVTGCSAGSIAAGIHGASLSTHYANTSPNTKIIVLGDSFMMLTTDDFVRNRLLSWGLASACNFMELMYRGDGIWDGVSDYGLSVWKGVRNTIAANGNGVTVVVSSVADKVQAKYYRLMGENGDDIEGETSLRILSRASATDAAFIFEGEEHCKTSLSTPMDNSELSDTGQEALASFLSVLFDDTSPFIPQSFVCPLCTENSLIGCDSIIGSGALVDNCGQCQGDLSLSACSVEEPAWATQCRNISF